MMPAGPSTYFQLKARVELWRLEIWILKLGVSTPPGGILRRHHRKPAAGRQAEPPIDFGHWSGGSIGRAGVGKYPRGAVPMAPENPYDPTGGLAVAHLISDNGTAVRLRQWVACNARTVLMPTRR